MKNISDKLASVVLAGTTNIYQASLYGVPNVEDYSKRPNLFVYIGMMLLIFILGIVSQFKLSSPKDEKIKKHKNVLFCVMIVLIITISQVYVYNILTYEPSYSYGSNYIYYDSSLMPMIFFVAFSVVAVILKNSKEDERSKVLNKMSHVAVLIAVMCLEVLIFSQISGLCDYSDYLDFYINTLSEIIAFIILGILGIVLQVIALKSKRSILRKIVAILGIIIILVEVILAGNLILTIL